MRESQVVSKGGMGEHGIFVLDQKNLIFVLENLSSHSVALYTQTLLPYSILPRMRRGRYRVFTPIAATGWKRDACGENNKVIRLGDWQCDMLLRSKTKNKVFSESNGFWATVERRMAAGCEYQL